jgi:hypothetical protein
MAYLELDLIVSGIKFGVFSSAKMIAASSPIWCYSSAELCTAEGSLKTKPR